MNWYDRIVFNEYVLFLDHVFVNIFICYTLDYIGYKLHD